MHTGRVVVVIAIIRVFLYCLMFKLFHEDHINSFKHSCFDYASNRHAQGCIQLLLTVFQGYNRIHFML